MMGNPVIKKIKNYRKTLIIRLVRPSLEIDLKYSVEQQGNKVLVFTLLQLLLENNYVRAHPWQSVSSLFR